MRCEASILLDKLDAARALATSDRVAALELAAKVLEAACAAVHWVEIGDPDGLGLSQLRRRLLEAGLLPGRLGTPVDVVATLRGTKNEDLDLVALYGSSPWRNGHRCTARVLEWFFSEYLGSPATERLLLPDTGASSRRGLRLISATEAGAGGLGTGPDSKPRAHGEEARSPAGDAEEPRPLHPDQEAEARRLGVPAELIDEPTGIRFRLVPGGTFWVGAPPTDERAIVSEWPRHRVRLQPFYCGIAPVLQREWCRFMDSNPSHFPGDGRPVDNLCWDDAQEFVRRANLGRTGPPLRLLLEAEWERAARGGTTTRYWWGSGYRPGWANCAEDGYGSGRLETSVAGEFPQNPYGLSDLLGNVEEWCEDVWLPSHDDAPAFSVPRRRPDSKNYTIRGGSWISPPGCVRVTSRQGRPADYRCNRQGFRCSLSIQGDGSA